MKNQTQVRERQNSGPDRSMRNLKPGRSMTPPKAELQARDGFLTSTVGRGGENRPEDLRKLGQFLYDNKAPLALVANVVNPAINDRVIERYQREVLGFNNPDGRIDPGGKTIAAIRELQGSEIVTKWFAPKPSEKQGADPESGGNAPKAKKGEIPMVLFTSQYFSQYNEGAPCVPLSLLKANLSKKSSEKGYRDVGCYQTCRYMLMQAGHEPGSKADAEYLLTLDSKGKKGEAGFQKSVSGFTQNFASSLSALDESLLKGKPVIVGVNNSRKNFTWTNQKSDGKVSPTDHFVVVVGKTVTGDGKVAYRFFDPARYSLSKGTSKSNLLIQGDNGQLTANPYGKNHYSMSEIRAL